MAKLITKTFSGNGYFKVPAGVTQVWVNANLENTAANTVHLFSNIKAIGSHSLALKSDGRVFAWGTNTSGRLGLDDILNRSTPTQVINESDFVAISGGNTHSLALKSDGRVFAWGSSGSGLLGLGDLLNRSTPTQVINESDFVAISGGTNHSLALKADGRVFAWGAGSNGLLGLGVTGNRSTPTQVVNESGFVAISGGNQHSLALKSDGRVFAWGFNTSGQLGLQSNFIFPTPKNDISAMSAYSNCFQVSPSSIVNIKKIGATFILNINGARLYGGMGSSITLSWVL